MATLGSLPVGAVVKSLGTAYNGAVIRWLVGHQDTANGRTKLVTERIITIKPYDAKEPTNPTTAYANYGDSQFDLSNIDQWLNSAAPAGGWYSPSHEYDAPPISSNVWNGHNAFLDEAGFLNNFEEEFRIRILDSSIPSQLKYRGGNTIYITRKVYLLSAYEVGASAYGTTEGPQWAIFSNNASRLAYPTGEAVTRSTYVDNNLSSSKAWAWRLRTQTVTGSTSVASVTTSGDIGGNAAYSGTHGIRPAIQLSASTEVLGTPDTDGAYIIQWWTPPSVYLRIGGVSRSYADGAVKIDGVWRTIDEVHARIGGAWRRS